MGDFNFSKKQCIRALKKLGFYENGKRRGIHDKYCPPKGILKKLIHDQPHFIMIPRHNELHVQMEIVKELRAMGGDELAEQFKGYL
jgi:predicted RNA binding protein YcfA (HicA-like mRNA interferase family)